MKQAVNTNLLLVAILLVAVLACVAGVHGFTERQRLLEHGVETRGLVIGIDVGVKGLRSVEARFTTQTGDEVVGRDVHKTQWWAANDIGDQVTLHYDPREPRKILIHRGLAMWYNPAFLLGGSLFLLGLMILIHRHSSADAGAS